MRLWRIDAMFKGAASKPNVWMEWMVLAATKEHALLAVEKETSNAHAVEAFELDAMTLSGPRVIV